MPRGVQRFGLFLPATYLVNGVQQAILNGATPWSRYVEILSLALWACLTFFLSSQLFRWEPEAKVPRRAKLLVAATVIPFLLLGVVENMSDRVLVEASTALARFDSGPSPARPALGIPVKPPGTKNPSNSDQK
jgi:hypothetical protein